MAKSLKEGFFYAVVKKSDNHPQKLAKNGQLCIYEFKNEAKLDCQQDEKIIEIKISTHERNTLKK